MHNSMLTSSRLSTICAIQLMTTYTVQQQILFLQHSRIAIR